MRVDVRGNDVEQALRVLRKKMQREGVLRDMRRKEAYEKPGDRRRRGTRDAIRRRHKAEIKRARRAGLV